MPTKAQYFELVRDHIPTKQGLRHEAKVRDAAVHCLVRDHIPTKQGLRPLSTSYGMQPWQWSETIFQQNKDSDV